MGTLTARKTAWALGASMVVLLLHCALPSVHIHHEHQLLKRSNIIVEENKDNTLAALNRNIYLEKRADDGTPLVNSTFSEPSSSFSSSQLESLSSLSSYDVTSSSSSEWVRSETSTPSSTSQSIWSSETSYSSSTTEWWTPSSSSEWTTSSSSSSWSSSWSSSSTSSSSSSSSSLPEETTSSSESSSTISSTQRAMTTSVDPSGVTIIIQQTTTVTLSPAYSTATASSTRIAQATGANTDPNGHGDGSSLSNKDRNVIIGVVVGVGFPLISGLMVFIWWKFFKGKKRNMFINAEGEIVSKTQYKKQNGSNAKSTSKFDQDEMIDEKIFDDTVNNDSHSFTGNFFEGDTFVGGRGHSRGPSQNTHINY